MADLLSLCTTCRRINVASELVHKIFLKPEREWAVTDNFINALVLVIDDDVAENGTSAARELRLHVESRNAEVQLLALTCLEACAAECAPRFRDCLVQKRVPEALGSLVLSRGVDAAVREKCTALVAHWAAAPGFAPRAFAEAAEALRVEGVPLEALGARFGPWLTARDAAEQAAEDAAAAARRAGRAGRAPTRLEADILPFGKDGRARGGDAGGGGGVRGGDALFATSSGVRWNAAGRRASAGPEGNDRFRTGSGSKPRGSSDEEEEEEEEEEEDDVAEAETAWVRKPKGQQQQQQRAARPRGMPRGISSDMEEAVMMQEMLALDLKDEGEALLEDGDLEGALQVYTQALSYAPNYRLYAARAACLLRLGRPEDAAADAAHLVALLPSFHAGHALAAQAAEAQGAHAAARAAFDKALFLAEADGDGAAAEEYREGKRRVYLTEATHDGYYGS